MSVCAILPPLLFYMKQDALPPAEQQVLQGGKGEKVVFGVIHSFQLLLRFWMLFAPERQPLLTKKVLKIQQQILQTSPRRIDQFESGFLGSAGGNVAFGDILFAAERCLQHLIMGAEARGLINRSQNATVAS